VIAIFLNVLFVHHLVAPTYLYALTGGPSSPEFTGFTPAGASELVNLFSGDFSYNIPLMDVGGYPVNLAYNAGIGMEDEASWVGTGWNINPGAINRQVRGLPDDFAGDEVKREYSIKDNHSFGVKAKMKYEFAGFGDKAQGFQEMKEKMDKIEANNKRVNQLIRGLNGRIVDRANRSDDVNAEIDNLNNESVDLAREVNEAEDNTDVTDMKKSIYPYLGFTYNNYRGVGLEVGVTLGSMIKKKNDMGHNLSSDFSFGTQNGLGMSMSGASFGQVMSGLDNMTSHGTYQKGGGFSMNSREGLTSIGFTREKTTETVMESGGSTKYKSSARGGSYDFGFTSPSTSFPQYPSRNFGFTAGVEPGTEGYFAKGQTSFKGYYSGQFARGSEFDYSGYGYLYIDRHDSKMGDYENGSEKYLMDYTREGDKVLSRDVPNLPIPVLTHDIYHASGQGMSMSFRAHRYDNGVVNDPNVRNNGLDGSLEFDLGVGNTADFGVDAGLVISKANKGKWNAGMITDEFYFKSAAEMGVAHAKPYYFKSTGDMALMDDGYYNSMNGDGMLMPELRNTIGLFIKTKNNLIDGDGFSQAIGSDVTMNLNKPDVQNNIVGLTGLEASSYGLQRVIEYYDTDGNERSAKRVGSEEGYEKREEHISEFHVTRPDGSHYVYGLPVYNKTAKQVSFSLDPDDTYGCDKLISYAGFTGDVTAPGHKHGHDRYFNSETTPPYVAAHLITGILSSDYEDLTGDGISDDDHGSAVKFSYTKQAFKEGEETTDFYRYRTPSAASTAKVNEGLLSDPYDNKASYSYGEKEVYYLNNIESKNFIAKFILNDPDDLTNGHKRSDGLGVLGEDGGIDENQRLRRLERIELYSKEDLAKNGSNAVPIKTVHFYYDYSLCTGIPNADVDAGEAGGKLTLKKVWFTYGQSSKGSLSSYKFDYADFNPTYKENNSDNWGSYKKGAGSLCEDVTSYPNDLFPYASQLDDPLATDNVDKWASAWNLKRITLPSGGTIEVSYEADDYGHVQNQDAMRMFNIVDTYYDLNESGSLEQNTCRLYEHSGNNKANYTYLVFDLEENLDESVYNTQDLADERIKNLYGNLGRGSDGTSIDKLFYKCEVYINPDKDPDLEDLRETISGYADVESWGALKSNPANTDYDRGYVKLTAIDMNGGKARGNDEVHPIAYESWNFLRKYLNKYVNQISEPKTSGILGQTSSPIGEGMKVFRELVKSYGQELQRLFKGVNRMMRSSGFAEKIVAGRSMIRLSDPNKTKLGGGHRVAAVRINDNWKDLTGSAHEELAGTYGQDYSYTTWDKASGSTISSGVAANEPMLGWEECALKQFDEVWKQKKILATASYSSFERPYGHSFLPGASVGYSAVAVSAYNPTSGVNKIERTATGKTVHEFYTTRDYPSISKESEIQQKQSKPQYSKTYKQKKDAASSKFFKYKNNVLGLAQGYLIETNDMNGRQKATHTYSEGAPEFDEKGNRMPGINYSQYHYTIGETAVLDKDGGIDQKQNIDIDFVLEATQSRSQTITPHLQFQVEVAAPVAFTGAVPSGAYDKSEVRYVVSTKHVHKRAILTEITTSERGIKNVVTNHRMDPVAGGTALSRTFNEFGDPVYSMNIPGYWAYEELSGKAQRQDLIFSNVSLGASNEVLQSGVVITGLKNGDKVVLKRTLHGYPMGHTMNNDPMLGQKEPIFWYLEGKLIDRTGEVLTLAEVNSKVGSTAYLQIIDPAETNMLGATVGAISSLSDVPLDFRSLNAQAKVLSASAVAYKDRWRTECCGFQMPFTGYYQYCGDGPCDIVNPFVKGILGKMRPHKSWTVYADRNSSYTASNDIDVRFDGDIKDFELFWEYDVGTGLWKADDNPTVWTWTNEITEYDVSGTAIENNNRLEQRSSELLGYDKMLAVAAGQNSRYGEMAFDGFEDYNYKRVPHSSDYLQTASIHNQCMYEPHFGFTNPEKDYFTHTTDVYAHTGLKCLEVDPAELANNSLSLSFETYDAHAQAPVNVPFTMDKGDCFTRFYPEKSQTYSLSLWLREETVSPDGYTNSEARVAFYDVNNVLISQEIFTASGDLIEGWQRIYNHFEVPSNCESIVVSMNATGSESSFFDDVRIYPKDGAMTSYVYHPHTMRLSATLDANNFASFYEYDAEGGLVRVKKETEEGIVTLQESRKHLIDNTTP